MWALDWLVCISKLCSPGESFTISRKGQALQDQGPTCIKNTENKTI